jgi:hypothetical protein
MKPGAFKPHNPGPSSLRKQRNADADAAEEPDAGSRANERPPVALADTHTQARTHARTTHTHTRTTLPAHVDQHQYERKHKR